MDPDLKKKWVEALRSGEYKQGTGYLVTVNENGFEFCCLGVALCVIPTNGFWSCRSDISPTVRRTVFFTEEYPDGPVGYGLKYPPFDWSKRNLTPARKLTKEALIEAGSQNLYGYGNDKVTKILARMNDKGKTFDQIADWIEKWL